MKKLSLVLAAALLLGGISFAQNAAPAKKAAPAKTEKNTPAKKMEKKSSGKKMNKKAATPAAK